MSYVKFYVKHEDGVNCVAVNEPQHMKITERNQPTHIIFDFWTDANGYYRLNAAYGQYDIYTNAVTPPCALCKYQWDWNGSSLTVNLCNPCATAPRSAWFALDPTPGPAPIVFLVCHSQDELCLPVTAPQKVTIPAPNGAPMYEFWTDADGYARLLMQPGEYTVLTNGGCATEITVTGPGTVEICSECAVPFESAEQGG